MMASQVRGSAILVRQLGLRSFSTFPSVARVGRSASGAPLNSWLFESGTSSAAPAAIVRLLQVRMASTSAAPASIGGEDDRSSKGQANASIGGEEDRSSKRQANASIGGEEDRSSKGQANPSGSNQMTSYWGVAPRKLFREDGSEWRWSCFRPWDTYMSDTTIDLKKHHAPKVFLDKIAYWTVKLLRVPTDIFFQRRYGCRAMMLETVAAVPGMVGGMLLHLRSLRRFEHSGGWVRALLEEAENERMHLMSFMEVTQPRWYERALVIAVQGIFFNAYFVGYLISPKFAHRVVGYLEEEAIHSYTEFLKELDNGNIENVPAPEIAKDYWRLPPDATLRDVVMVVRADEAHHRDVNHFASDVHYQGMDLKQTPAPVGYH